MQSVKDPCAVSQMRLPVRRLVPSRMGIAFHGSGFYATDHRSEEYKREARKDGEPGPPPLKTTKLIQASIGSHTDRGDRYVMRSPFNYPVATTPVSSALSRHVCVSPTSSLTTDAIVLLSFPSQGRLHSQSLSAGKVHLRGVNHVHAVPPRALYSSRHRHRPGISSMPNQSILDRSQPPLRACSCRLADRE